MSQLEHIPAIHLRAVKVTGPDAVAFVQSQLTIDVDGIAESRLCPAAWCSPDGRVDAVMLICVEAGTVDLVLPEPLVEPIRTRARMFGIGRKIVLGEDLAVRPSGPADADPGRAIPLALDPDRSLLLDAPAGGTKDNLEPLPDAWLQADIQHTMPWLLPETAGRYLPQMLGLDALGGLSYRKGCFPGQEVIARVHYRGRVTRRVARFRLDAKSPPEPGQEFELAGKPAQVLYAVSAPDAPGTVTGLAVVSAEVEDSAEIVVGSTPGTLF